MHKYVEKCGGKRTVDIIIYSDDSSSLSVHRQRKKDGVRGKTFIPSVLNLREIG
jgi:hypothetical protein